MEKCGFCALCTSYSRWKADRFKCLIWLFILSIQLDFLTLQLAWRLDAGLGLLKMTSSARPLNSEQKKEPKKWVSTLRVDSVWKDNANFQYLKLFCLQSLLVFVLFVLMSGHFYLKTIWNSLLINWGEADADVAGTPRWLSVAPTDPNQARWRFAESQVGLKTGESD